MNKRLEELLKMMAEDPKDPFLRYVYALELIALNRQAEAYEKLEELLNETPDYLPAYYIISRTAIDLQKSEVAVNWLTKGIQLAQQQKNKHTLAELMGVLDEISE